VEERLRKFVDKLKGAFLEDLWGVILFGSRARGEAEKNSDYDIFIVLDNIPFRPIERQEFIIDRIGAKGNMNIIAKTREEFESSFPSLYLDLALDGIILFDRDGYMEKRLIKIKNIIKNTGLMRERRYYGFNWKWKKAPQSNWKIDWEGVYGIG